MKLGRLNTVSLLSKAKPISWVFFKRLRMNKLQFYIILLCLLIHSCKQSSNEVVVYCSVDQVFSEPILKDFERETGIKVKPVFDTEETKSTGVMNRLIAEKNNPQCDVFWSGDPVLNIVLKTKGVTAPFSSSNTKLIPEYYKSADQH